jgi:hypothetical protein
VAAPERDAGGSLGRRPRGHAQLISERLKRRGESTVTQLAESLTNPMYYSDLDAIGDIARAAMRQPDVTYVLVFDPQGRIVHDGSGDIPAFGQPMNDPFAYEVVSARNTHVQSSDRVVDIASPIMIGDQRLGGVRVGFSLAAMQRDEDRATAAMHSRLDEIARAAPGVDRASVRALLVLGAIVVGLVQKPWCGRSGNWPTSRRKSNRATSKPMRR